MSESEVLHYLASQWSLAETAPPLSSVLWTRVLGIDQTAQQVAKQEVKQASQQNSYSNQTNVPQGNFNRASISRPTAAPKTSANNGPDLQLGPANQTTGGLWDALQANIQSQGGGENTNTRYRAPAPAEQANSETSTRVATTRSKIPNFKDLNEFYDYLATKGPYGNDSIIRSFGEIDAPICVISLVPSEADALQHQLFSGEDGELLDKILTAIHLDRSRIYATALWKNLAIYRKLSLRDQAALKPLVMRELEMVRAKVCVILGEKGCQYLLRSGKSLAELRQEKTMHTADWGGTQRTLIATYHPAELRKKPNLKAEAWEDWKWIRNLIK